MRFAVLLPALCLLFQAFGLLLAIPALAQDFDPDNWPGAIDSSALHKQFGPSPSPARKYRFGVVVKFLGNEYWQLLANGMSKRAKDLGISLSVQGGVSEDDPGGQLEKMNAMVDSRVDAILYSPQTDHNLRPAVERARKAGIVLINVDDAVLPDAEHFVGPKQYENGERAAAFVMKRHPGGGEVAVIRGLKGVYAVNQRSDGFVKSLSPAYPVVAQEDGEWDLTKAMLKTRELLAKHPGLIAIYCNNDIMALGAVQAVKKAGKLGTVSVIGTDGINPAMDSIRKGELTATVDSYPFETGMVAVEAALRILEKQKLPRVVFSPQQLIGKDNLGARPDMGGLFGK